MATIEVVTDERPLTVSEAAEQLRVNLDTVRRWLRTGKLRGRRVGGRRGWLILPAEVRRFLETQGDEPQVR